MSEIATTNAAASTETAAPAAAEEENVFLLYVDDVVTNPGPGEFVMHGVNLFFRRGALTGPVTMTLAGIVTGRKKLPVIRIASADEIEALQPKEDKPAVVASEDKNDDDSADKKAADGEGTTTSSDTKSGDNAGSDTSGTTAPLGPHPDTSPATERKPKKGTTLTTG